MLWLQEIDIELTQQKLKTMPEEKSDNNPNKLSLKT